jgi:hypothetical protein
MTTLDVCPLCEQPVDLLDDVADVDDGKVRVPAHVHCPQDSSGRLADQARIAIERRLVVPDAGEATQVGF